MYTKFSELPEQLQTKLRDTVKRRGLPAMHLCRDLYHNSQQVVELQIQLLSEQEGKNLTALVPLFQDFIYTTISSATLDSSSGKEWYHLTEYARKLGIAVNSGPSVDGVLEFVKQGTNHLVDVPEWLAKELTLTRVAAHHYSAGELESKGMLIQRLQRLVGYMKDWRNLGDGLAGRTDEKEEKGYFATPINPMVEYLFWLLDVYAIVNHEDIDPEQDDDNTQGADLSTLENPKGKESHLGERWG